AIRFSCENPASRRSNVPSMPRRFEGTAAFPLPKIAAPLVRYSSRLTCRSNSRFAMEFLGARAGCGSANAGDIVQDFVKSLEPVVTLEHDEIRTLTLEHVLEQLERLVRYRMRMRIGEERTPRCVS